MSHTQSTPPVSQGDSYHIGIQELGTEGDGIGYVDDFVIIVPGSTIGESVTVEVERVEDHFAMARQVERHEL